MSESKLGAQDWTIQVEFLQFVLNEAPRKGLGPKKDGPHRTPVKVIIGNKPGRT